MKVFKENELKETQKIKVSIDNVVDTESEIEVVGEMAQLNEFEASLQGYTQHISCRSLNGN